MDGRKGRGGRGREGKRAHLALDVVSVAADHLAVGAASAAMVRGALRALRDETTHGARGLNARQPQTASAGQAAIALRNLCQRRRQIRWAGASVKAPGGRCRCPFG